MGTIVIVPLVAGQPTLADPVNQNFNRVKAQVNGNLEDANISNTADIVDTKLHQITSANKVDGSTAITGLIPSASQDTILPIVFANPLPTDASAATIFTSTATSDFTLSNPTSAVAGMKRIWRITQGVGGNHAITLDTEFRVASTIDPAGTLQLSRDVGAIDYIGALYDGTNWDIIAFVKKMI